MAKGGGKWDYEYSGLELNPFFFQKKITVVVVVVVGCA